MTFQFSTHTHTHTLEHVWKMALCIFMCVCVCIYIKGISYITVFLSFMAGEQRKCLYHCEYQQFRKDVVFLWCLFFVVVFKKKVNLTLTMLLNVCVSLLLLKINELVKWWRVSREVYKYQEWPVLLIFSILVTVE